MKARAILRHAALALAALVLANSVRAQAPEVGAQVFLYQPGSISATLLAAPATTLPNIWDTAIFYNPQSGADLFNSTSNSTVGSATVTPAIPFQTSPLFISTFFGTVPPGSGQGDATGSFVSTGFTAGSNRPGGTISPTASVLFGANQTAQIGFAPPNSPAPSSFLDFPLRISLTNVWNGGGIGTVPEPSTWALTLAGLLAAGFMWRRRAR